VGIKKDATLNLVSILTYQKVARLARERPPVGVPKGLEAAIVAPPLATELDARSKAPPRQIIFHDAKNVYLIVLMFSHSPLFLWLLRRCSTSRWCWQRAL
jgi:hypothetical protein